MSDPRDVQQIVAATVDLARPVILEGWREDSCIASTRVVLDVLDYFGVLARPLSVRVAAYNQRAWQRVREGLDALDDDDPLGPWSVGIGYGEQLADGLWPGHLTVLTRSENPAETRWLIDPSLDQASRPQRGLPLRPFADPVTDAAFPLDMRHHAVMTVDGVFLVYEALPHDRSYRVAHDWTDRRRHRAAAGRIIRAVRERVPGAPL